MIDRLKSMNNEHYRNRVIKRIMLYLSDKRKQQEKNANDSENHYYYY